MNIVGKFLGLFFDSEPKTARAQVLLQQDHADLRKLAAIQNREAITQQLSHLRREISAALTSIVLAHGRTLHIKLRQLSYQDDYGNYILDKFFPERDYFIQKVMCREIPRAVLEFFFYPKNYNETTSKIFHESFSRFLERDSTDSAGLGLKEMGPLDYEQHCAELLRASGWEARTTVATGDQGVDIVAMSGLTKIVGQCKLYSSPVGNAAVQQVIGGREFEQAHHAFVVTNAGFTPAARALAASANVLLVHHSELADLHKKLNVPMAQTPRQTQASLSESTFQISEMSRPVSEIVKDAESLMANAYVEGITPRDLLGSNWGTDYPNGEKDPMYDQAVEVVLKNRKASISLVQRHLKIGYNRAARLVEDMENAGLVSAMSGSGQREILVPARAE